uniref:hypothetical protein n=1 Tax=Pseudomonas aeruginosa TaxID=287 RepID=UPI002B4132C6
GFGVFVLPPDKEVKFINSQLVQVVITNKAATIDLTNIPDSKDKRICVATVDINNNISPLLELK